MKLLKLPMLVHQEIYGHLSVEEKLILSLCSRSTAYSIKQFRWNVLGVMFYFGPHWPGMRLEVPETMFFRGSEEFRFHSYNFLDGYFNLTEAKTDRVVCKCKFESKTNNFSGIQSHISELFSKSRQMKFTVTIAEIENYRWVPLVKRASFIKQPVNADQLQEFISKHPDLEALLIGEHINGELVPESNVFNVPNLRLDELSRPLVDYLKNFKGKNAFLWAPDDATIQVQYFIQLWYSGTFSQNLKAVFIHQPANKKFFDSLLRPFLSLFKPWSETGMPNKWPYSYELEYYFHVDPAYFDFEGGVYIERKKDGRKATIELSDKVFLFCVWD